MNWMRAGRSLVPAPVRRALRTLIGSGDARFAGPFPDWESAAAAAGGYDAAGILAKVREAARAVRRGDAAFERDSVTFAAPEPWPHTAVLERLARGRNGRLNVLDFGGSLGSTYGQCRRFLGSVERLRWRIVEQPAFVAVGRREFETPELGFFDSIEEASADEPPDLALFSSSLQYVRDPGDVARRIARVSPRVILVDRVPLGDAESIWVQHVPPAIYRASYPFRVFTRARLAALFGDRWRATADLPPTPFPGLERRTGARYGGLLLERG